MEQRLTLITLGVDDHTRMRSFYREVFGWNPTDDSNENITFFQLNGILLALFGRQELAEDARVDPGGSGFKRFTLAHNLRSEQEVNELFQELVEKGAEAAKQPENTPWGGYSGYVADPEGNLWEIAFNPFMEFDEDGNVAG